MPSAISLTIDLQGQRQAQTIKRAMLGLVIGACLVACGKDDEVGDEAGDRGSPDQVGSVCELAADCYPELDHAELSGDVICMDRVRGGYCTHECVTDEDCCAIEGECLTDLPQVCSPFESTGLRMCFLSCERADWEGAGARNEQTFCQNEASPDFICRSSGGGSANRKVCVPGDCGVGAACAGDEDCDPDLDCISDFDGGYCGRADCTSNADCPGASVCITVDDRNYCARPCELESDCGFCRPADVRGTCTTHVGYVGDASVPVCVP